jgi:hypothetical protein
MRKLYIGLLIACAVGVKAAVRLQRRPSTPPLTPVMTMPSKYSGAALMRAD